MYQMEMHHTEATFTALAHMQYDLFCTGNRVARTALSAVLILAGVVNFSSWWGVLLVAYACYLTTSTYSAPNHTARKLTRQLQQAGMPFPASRYRFTGRELEIHPLTGEEREVARLAYADVCRLGEDGAYFYLFRDPYGGYMVPKQALEDQIDSFRDFIQRKTGLAFRARTAPWLRLVRWLHWRRL